MSPEHRDHHDDDAVEEAAEPARPPARNPFDPEAAEAADDRPALITTKRSAAIWGVLAGFVFLVLVVGICVLASLAFG